MGASELVVRVGREYYGWLIVGVVFLAAALTIGSSNYAFGLFIEPLEEEFGCSSDLKSSVAVSKPQLGNYTDQIGLLVTSHNGNARPAQGCEIQEQVPHGLAGHLQEHQLVN